MTNLETRPETLSKLPPDIKLSPELKHILNFLVNIGYNPSYKEDQEAIINKLSTAPTDEVLPQEIKAVYNVTKEKQIPSLACKLDDQSIVKIDSGSNKISTIRHLEPSGRLLGIFRKYAIRNYFMADSVTGKAWDVSQLWKDTTLPSDNPKRNQKPTQVFNIPDIFNAAFVMTKDGPNLILNRMSEHKKKAVLLNKIGSEGLEIVDNLIPIHESAHRVMHNRSRTDDSLGKTFLKDYLSGFTRKFAEPIFRVAVAFSQWAGLGPEMAIIKRYVVETERNAHAFYLRTTRRLKELGIDINRNIPYQSVWKVIDYTLGTYDKSPIRYLPGLGYSEEVRRKQRLKELHQHPTLSPA